MKTYWKNVRTIKNLFTLHPDSSVLTFCHMCAYHTSLLLNMSVYVPLGQRHSLTQPQHRYYNQENWYWQSMFSAYSNFASRPCNVPKSQNILIHFCKALFLMMNNSRSFCDNFFLFPVISKWAFAFHSKEPNLAAVFHVSTLWHTYHYETHKHQN